MSVLALLQSRRRLKPKTKQMAQPHSQELRYASALLGMMGQLRRQVTEHVTPHLSQIAREDALYGRIANGVRLVRDWAQQIDPEPIVEETAKRLNAWNRREAARLIGIDVGDLPTVAVNISRWREDNVGRIRSLARETIDDVAKVLDENQGLRHEDLAELLQQRLGVGESRAVLIARDQVLKLNADMTQGRQQAAGITQYTWRTVGDSRVRPEHQKLNGTVHGWTVAPMSGPNGEREHPGKAVQCRCQAIPVIPE